MGLWDSVKKQFIEVIECTEGGDGLLMYRFPVADREIKNGAQLTVRESQAALFVNEGEAADQFAPGRHTLETKNLPILTKLKSWPFGFNSPFKAEVYFFFLRQQLGQRWGTPAPITIRDKEFGSVQIRMFGIFSYHLADIPTFYREVAGTRGQYTVDELNQQLLGHVAGAAAQAFASSGVPFLDVAANQMELGKAILAQLVEPASKLGVKLDSFIVENVSLPKALQEALDQKQTLGILGNDMQKFAQYQMAKSIPDAMKASGGIAGLGAGLAAGVGVGNMMGQMFGEAANPGHGASPGAAAAPPAAPAAAMKGCVGCAKGIDAEAEFCRWCGVRQSVACGQCGTKAAGDAGFCAKCGNKLK